MSELAIDNMSLSDNESQPVSTRGGRRTRARPGTKAKGSTLRKKPEKANGISFKIGGSRFSGALKRTPEKPTPSRKKGGTEVDDGMDLGGTGNDFGEADNIEEEMMRAAIQASFVTAAQEISASLMTAGAGSSTSRGTRASMSVSPKKGQSVSPTKRGVRKSKPILSDSDSGSPLASKVAKKKGKQKRSAANDVLEQSSSESEYDGSAMEVDIINLSSDEEEATDSGIDEEDEEEKRRTNRWRRRNPPTQDDSKAKAELKKLEMQERKRLGRRLTYVSTNSDLADASCVSEPPFVGGEIDNGALPLPPRAQNRVGRSGKARGRQACRRSST